MSKLGDRPQNKNFGKVAKAANKRRAEKNEQEYYKSPKLCKQCNAVLPYRSYKDFCNRSCSTTFNNKRKSYSEKTNRKRSESLKKYHGSTSKNGHILEPKSCKIQFSTCNLCKTSFYVKHHKNIKNNICSECKTSNYCLVNTNTCKCCGMLFLSQGYRKYCDSCSPNIRHYRTRAKFDFNVYEYPTEFDLSLIEKYGWYSPNGYKRRNKSPNLTGVSRDHLYTIHDGFHNNVDPSLLSHPANCKIMSHNGKGGNNSKNNNSSITLNELRTRISTWDKKYS